MRDVSCITIPYYVQINFLLQILHSLSLEQYNASLLELPRVNIILFEDLAQKLQTTLHTPNNLIHTLFIMTSSSRINVNTSVSVHIIASLIHSFENIWDGARYAQLPYLGSR